MPNLKDLFEQSGQGQVFAFWSKLDEEGRARLLQDAGEVDLPEVADLVTRLVKGVEESGVSLDGLEPAPYIPHPGKGGDPASWAEAREIGETAIRAGKVAAFTVAGGQGTRLGFDGPKGTFPVTPVTGKPLFGVFAEKILAAGRRYGVRIPWFIMTSQINHEATVAAFRAADFFGMDEDQVMFFSQGRMPAVDHDGKILLEEQDRIAMSPDGHGGSLRALYRSGAIARMREMDVSVLSYFQVDNPLIKIIDPAFIGFHLKGGSEMSSKMIPKAYPGEKVGHFCTQGGRTLVVEYSDMPESMQEETSPDGRLRFLAGSIAIHILDVGFVERIGSGQSDARLPFHRADKKIRTIDPEGNPVEPSQPNGIKFEMFVFDALPFARNPVIIETLREADFSPVKNATGIDSADSAKADQIREWTRWLQAAGVDIETDESGLPGLVFEVSPLFADSQEAFMQKWQELLVKPQLIEGAVLA